MLIRTLDPNADLARVVTFYRQTQDYWLLAEGRPPDAQKAADFFTDGPPGCDPARSFRLGLFLDGELEGLAELSFGFPQAGDAYLGLMLLSHAARGRGLGRRLLEHVETLARAAASDGLYLGVLESNPRGRAFWEREGFQETGLSRASEDGELRHVTHRLVKDLQPGTR